MIHVYTHVFLCFRTPPQTTAVEYVSLLHLLSTERLLPEVKSAALELQPTAVPWLVAVEVGILRVQVEGVQLLGGSFQLICGCY